MKQIGVEGVSLTEYEMNIATHLVDPRSIKVTTNTVVISANLSSNHTVPLITSEFCRKDLLLVVVKTRFMSLVVVCSALVLLFKLIWN